MITVRMIIITMSMMIMGQTTTIIITMMIIQMTAMVVTKTRMNRIIMMKTKGMAEPQNPTMLKITRVWK